LAYIEAVRILAGALKGKLLRYPRTSIRPTTEMIRASIFNILGDKIIQATVGDFFCGAGGLGIEALSRGAQEVYFFEKSPIVLKYLKENVAGLTGVNIIRGDVLKKIKTIKDKQFKVMIADPPYLKGLLNRFIDIIIGNEILAEDGFIVLQHHKKEEINLPKGLFIEKQKRHGETVITIIRRKNEDSRLPG
jgi:16S rRNA (guanine966-N2)-methyltransferase